MIREWGIRSRTPAGTIAIAAQVTSGLNPCTGWNLVSELRFRVWVPADRVVKLPDEVAVGLVELVVVPSTAAQAPEARAAIATALMRSAPPQQTDSATLVREDRHR